MICTGLLLLLTVGSNFACAFTGVLSINPTIMDPLLVASARSLSDLNFLSAWRSSLLKGITPKAEQSDVLVKKVSEKLNSLQLPRLVQRHPTLCSSVLLFILKAKQEYERQLEERDETEKRIDSESFSKQVDDDSTHMEELFETAEMIADEIVQELFQDFGAVCATAPLLEQIDSDLVSQFGLQDGIWEHTGWGFIPSLLRELEQHKKLRQLLARLGKRPTATESSRNQDFFKRTRSRTGLRYPVQEDSMVSSIAGLKLAGNLRDMLPSEAVLLKGSPILRKLFLSRLVEDKLWSYQNVGYEDILNTQTMLRKSRQPMQHSGPIFICLDTSDSMSTFQREQLSKTVVLATVRTALKQHRVCRIVAFANTGNLISPGEIRNDKAGISKLLDFLSYRFVSGGTDITGALRYAIDQLEECDNADLLLVTDGEIPFVTDESLLEKLQRRTFEVHGLSLGNQKSDSLDQICTETHDFLMKRDFLSDQRGWGRERQSLRVTRADTTRLLARRRRFDDWEEELVQVDPLPESPFHVQEVHSCDYDTEVSTALKWLQRSAERKVEETKTLQPSILPISIRLSLELAISSVSSNLLERDEEARLVVLGYLSGEHILFLGPPGTAKSQLGRRLSLLCGRPFFQRLLTRFTTPEELFGPLSLQALEMDVYRRQTQGYLPSASIAFLDEIFKANSAILNTLLTILNERKFDNGGIRDDCPVKCVIAASNELPENEELDALFDRFLLRKEVKALSDEGLLTALLMKSPGDVSSDINTTASTSLDNTIDAVQVLLESVEVSTHAAILIKDLRSYLRDTLDVDLSDRRLIQTARLLRICAASNGRRRVEPIDCMLLQHIAWKNPDHQLLINEWLRDNITPGKDLWQLGTVLDTMRQEAIVAVRKTAGDCSGDGGARRADIERIASIREECSRIADVLQTQKDDLDTHIALTRDADSHLWLGRSEAQSLKESLALQAQQSLSNVKALLVKAYMVEEALSPSNAVSDKTRLDVIEGLWSGESNIQFSEDEFELSIREAKTKFSDEVFRKWKRQRKRISKS